MSHGRWTVFEDEDGNRHVLPIRDQREHDTSVDCWCTPRRDFESPWVVVHNSKDQREAHEKH